MRRILLAFFFTITFSTITFSQQNRFGLKSGIVFSNLTQQETEIGDVNIEWGGKAAYQTGAFYNRRLKNSLLSFQIEIDYKKIGTSFSIDDLIPQTTVTNTEVNYEFEYLGFSVLPRIDLLPDKKLNPNFMLGIVGEYRVNSELVISTPSGNDTTVTKNGFFGGQINHQTNSFLFGYVMAGGIEIKTKPVILTIEGRYTSLFTPIFKERIENLPLNGNTYPLKFMEDSRSQYASILLGFNFYFWLLNSEDVNYI